MTCNASRRHTSLPQGIIWDGTQMIARELCSTSLTFMQPAARSMRKRYPINEKCALKDGISFEVHQPDGSAPAFGLQSLVWWTEKENCKTYYIIDMGVFSLMMDPLAMHGYTYMMELKQHNIGRASTLPWEDPFSLTYISCYFWSFRVLPLHYLHFGVVPSQSA